MAMWNGQLIAEAQWKSVHADVRLHLESLVRARKDRALREESAALGEQVRAAHERLLRELGRFLACAQDGDEGFNSAFHRWMQRGGQTAALLARAHALVGYPEWSSQEVRAAANAADRLTRHQRMNVLLGTPLEAAIRDPRWVARQFLSR